MSSTRRVNPQYNVILGLCPGCDNWQVDYTDQVAQSYAGMTADAWLYALEDVLQEHMDECPDLQMVVIGALAENS